MPCKEKRSKALEREDSREPKPLPNQDYRAVEAADSLASGGRSSDEKQNNETLGTRKAEKVEKCTGISGSGDPAASFVFSE